MACLQPAEKLSAPRRVAGTLRRGASTMALVSFATLYFSALSLGSLAWVAMLFAPWLASFSVIRLPVGINPHWVWVGTVWALMWAGAGARLVHQLAKPRMRQTMPGGAWIAWWVVAWLAWLDAAFELGRGAPEGFQAAARRQGSVHGVSALGRAVVRATLAIPMRSMACALALAMMIAMPLGLHVMIALFLPLVLTDLLLTQGRTLRLTHRFKGVALDMSKVGSMDWAAAESKQLQKEVAAHVIKDSLLKASSQVVLPKEKYRL